MVGDSSFLTWFGYWTSRCNDSLVVFHTTLASLTLPTTGGSLRIRHPRPASTVTRSVSVIPVQPPPSPGQSPSSQASLYPHQVSHRHHRPASALTRPVSVIPGQPPLSPGKSPSSQASLHHHRVSLRLVTPDQPLPSPGQYPSSQVSLRHHQASLFRFMASPRGSFQTLCHRQASLRHPRSASAIN